MKKGNHLSKRGFINKVSIIALATILFLSYTGNVAFAITWENGSGGGYCDSSNSGNSKNGLYNDSPCPNTGSGTVGLSSLHSGSSIESLIEEGGGYFLKSYSTFLLFMQQIELSNLNGLDRENLARTFTEALTNIKDVNSVYQLLVEITSNTPYNSKVISKLKSFNYTEFSRRGRYLQPILSEVKSYLEQGNLNGIFEHTNKELFEIENLMANINSHLDKGELPDIQYLWEINQKFVDVLLFGQYVANVFKEI